MRKLAHKLKWMVMSMKSTKFLDEIKSKSVEELNAELVSAKKELFNLRFQSATSQLDNTSRIRDVRRNIARINTIITKKTMGLMD